MSTLTNLLPQFNFEGGIQDPTEIDLTTYAIPAAMAASVTPSASPDNEFEMKNDGAYAPSTASYDPGDLALLFQSS